MKKSTPQSMAPIPSASVRSENEGHKAVLRAAERGSMFTKSLESEDTERMKEEGDVDGKKESCDFCN